MIQLPSTVAQGDRQIPRELLAHIIHQRMDEIFDLVQREIRAAGFAGRLSGGVVLTGGAAAMQGVAELASDVFGTGVRVGVAVGEHRRAERLGRGAAIRDGGWARACTARSRVALGVAVGERTALSGSGSGPVGADGQDLAPGLLLGLLRTVAAAD